MLYLNKEVAVVSGRIPDRVMDKEGLNKHRKYCIGRALQEKLAEDKTNRMKHQIKIKEEDK